MNNEMGSNNYSPSHSPSKLVGVYEPTEEAYDLSQLNKAIIDEDIDAGGAIMKKLYRIHSRHILEPNDNLKIDISG
jgi:hypothetical protein